MKSLGSMLVCIVFVTLILPAAVFGAIQAPVTVDVEGYADIVSGKKDVARENALQNAFRRAIEQVMGVMIDSRTVVQNSELINDKILSKCSGFIKTYKITGETFRDDTCRISVTATVSTMQLEKRLDDVGLLIKKMGKPRVALIITEQNIGGDDRPKPPTDKANYARIAESVIHGFLAKRGYNLVDRETLVALARQSGLPIPAGGMDASDVATQAAAGGGAEVVIIGQAVAITGTTTLAGTNMRTSEASVSARAVDTDTGQIVVETLLETAKELHINPFAGGAEAIRKASQKLAERLNRQLVEKWKKRASGTRTARLIVKGVEYSDIANLRAAMRERLNCVEETIERSFRDGVLKLDMEINGTARELADEITNSDMKGFRFKVVSFTGNTLDLQLLR